ncbi:embryonic protein UVS.2-like isoform X2 [Mixophyes fleayi]|uniref:embryonic protein UVS.2-like isoform X2 n=1 Tax=Mixophyes fleayi TaxID=3061075 RepID=UPI003F4DCE88
MGLFLLIFTSTFLGVCAATLQQNPQERFSGSDRRDTGNDIFSDILSSNQGSSRFMLQGDIAVKRNRNALVCRGKSCLWPKSGDGLVRVPYTLSNNYTSEEKEIIQAAMEEVTVLTCIRFIPRHGEPDYLRIQPHAGCWSYIGRVGGAQDLSLMKTGCLHWGIIQHELLHALGFQHEQCRSDRDKYIRINWGNINQDKERNFYKMSTQNLGVPYDYLSVLHYGKFAFANDAGKPTLEPTGDPQAVIGQRVGLSSVDVVKINKLFQCNVCSYLLPDARGTFSWESKQRPNISTCVWLIRVPEDKVFLQFESFSVQSSPACAQGSVTVYDGMSTKSPILLQKTCGNVRPLGQVASGKLVRIELASRGTGINFKAIYNSIQCGRTLTRTTGNFSTPGFPGKYPNSANCVWILSAPAGNKITLHVAPFSLESSLNCSYDYFLLRDGQRQMKRCGIVRVLDFISTTRSLVVYFHSDSSVQENGFFATYSFAPIS